MVAYDVAEHGPSSVLDCMTSLPPGNDRAGAEETPDALPRLANPKPPGIAEGDVDQALISKLPDRLTDEQKRRKVHNLLQELGRSGRIENRGTRKRPQWVSRDGGEKAPS
jgi:hypothetical protein